VVQKLNGSETEPGSNDGTTVSIKEAEDERQPTFWKPTSRQRSPITRSKFIGMSGEDEVNAKTKVATLEEAVPLLISAWEAEGLIPRGGSDRHGWFKDVMETMKRAYGTEKNKAWAREYLISSRKRDVLEQRVATAMLQLPRLDSTDLQDQGLDHKNLELLCRGKDMESDESKADAELQDDSEPRLIWIEETDDSDSDERDEQHEIEEEDEQEEQDKRDRRESEAQRRRQFLGKEQEVQFLECSEHQGCYYKVGQSCAQCKDLKKQGAKSQDLGPQAVKELLGKLRTQDTKKKKKKKRSKKKKRRYDSDDSTSDSDSSEDSSEDEDQCDSVADVVSNTLTRIMNHNIAQSRMRPVAGGDYMSLTVNKLLQRNEKIVHDLQKLRRRGGAVDLTRATCLAEEYNRNQKELDLLERGLEEAKVDPELARRTVELVTKDRLKVSSENKEWERAQKRLRRDEKTELTHRMLYGGSSHNRTEVRGDWEEAPVRPRGTQPWRPAGSGKAAPDRDAKKKTALDYPVISKGPNLDIGPYQPDSQRRDRPHIDCNLCGGPHSGSWECSVANSPRWKFKQGLVDKWGQPIHSKQH
jgi:hypothetical protein